MRGENPALIAWHHSVETEHLQSFSQKTLPAGLFLKYELIAHTLVAFGSFLVQKPKIFPHIAASFQGIVGNWIFDCSTDFFPALCQCTISSFAYQKMKGLELILDVALMSPSVVFEHEPQRSLNGRKVGHH